MFEFNPEEVEDRSSDFELIPAGTEAKAMIIESDVDARDGWHRVSLTLEILEGKYEGRRVWDGLNMGHPNPTAASISEQTLKAICTAAGVTRLSGGIDELHGKPFSLTVGVQAAKGEYSAKNQIKKIKPLSAPTGFEGEPKAQEPGAEKAPWE